MENIIQKYIGNIVTIKFTNGEEIITKLVSLDTNKYNIYKPMTLIMMPPTDNKSTQADISFTPWIITSDEDDILYIKSSNVLLITDTREDAKLSYKIATKME